MSKNAPDVPPNPETPVTSSKKEEPIEIGETIVLGDRGSPAKGFTVPFGIHSSHDINSVGFRGQNTMSWPLPFNMENLEVAGIRLLRLIITRPKLGEYLLSVTTDQNLDEPRAGSLASTLENHLTFLLNRQNPNPQYGTLFVRFDFQDFRLIHAGEGIHVSESLAIRTEGIYRRGEDDWANVKHSDIIAYYCEGARTSEPKSKYFQWFRIIELIEGSERYRNHRSWSPLFSAAEQKLLAAVADFIGQERKKGIVQELFRRTTQSRHEKLASFLHDLGIREYSLFTQKNEVTPNVLKQLIGARNQLFHAGSNFDEKLLWQHLFPLVTAIAQAEYIRPLVLE